jgi:hypothetical protein
MIKHDLPTAEEIMRPRYFIAARTYYGTGQAFIYWGVPGSDGAALVRSISGYNSSGEAYDAAVEIASQLGAPFVPDLSEIAGRGGIGLCDCCHSVVYDEYCAFCQDGCCEMCAHDADRGKNYREYTREEWDAANPDLKEDMDSYPTNLMQPNVRLPHWCIECVRTLNHADGYYKLNEYYDDGTPVTVAWYCKQCGDKLPICDGWEYVAPDRTQAGVVYDTRWQEGDGPQSDPRY